MNYCLEYDRMVDFRAFLDIVRENSSHGIRGIFERSAVQGNLRKLYTDRLVVQIQYFQMSLVILLVDCTSLPESSLDSELRIRWQFGDEGRYKTRIDIMSAVFDSIVSALIGMIIFIIIFDTLTLSLSLSLVNTRRFCEGDCICFPLWLIALEGEFYQRCVRSP